MSALIKKSKIRKVDSGFFKGRINEKKEILKNIKNSGISERRLESLLKKDYGYNPGRRKKIINAIVGSNKKENEPQKMTWTQKMRQKEQERKLEKIELEKQRKLEAIEEEKRKKRAKVSGLMSRRMEEESQDSRMNFIGSKNIKKGISSNKKGSGFASNLAKPSSGVSAQQGSSSGFAKGGPNQNRDNFFHRN